MRVNQRKYCSIADLSRPKRSLYSAIRCGEIFGFSFKVSKKLPGASCITKKHRTEAKSSVMIACPRRLTMYNVVSLVKIETTRRETREAAMAMLSEEYQELG